MPRRWFHSLGSGRKRIVLIGGCMKQVLPSWVNVLIADSSCLNCSPVVLDDYIPDSAHRDKHFTHISIVSANNGAFQWAFGVAWLFLSASRLRDYSTIPCDRFAEPITLVELSTEVGNQRSSGTSLREVRSFNRISFVRPIHTVQLHNHHQQQPPHGIHCRFVKHLTHANAFCRQFLALTTPLADNSALHNHKPHTATCKSTPRALTSAS